MVVDGKKLKDALQKRGMNKSDLCRVAGVSSRTIAKIAKGEEIRDAVVKKIADALSVGAETLVRENTVLKTLRQEMTVKLSGGLYHETQVRLTYNSNHIEGSRLTEDQTRFIFETKTLGELPPDVTVDDVIETTNHFRCIDYVIAHAEEPLSEHFIKRLHQLLKGGTAYAATYGAGEYKRLPNTVGGIETTPPEMVGSEMASLIDRYDARKTPTFEDVVEFHYHFECIHPFQDGNGRIGRLLAFKECLRAGIVPFYIDDKYKLEYYNGLRRWDDEHGFLIETCRLGQDLYKMLLDYFHVPYQD